MIYLKLEIDSHEEMFAIIIQDKKGILYFIWRLNVFKKKLICLFILIVMLLSLPTVSFAEGNVTWNPDDKGSSIVLSDGSLLDVSKSANSWCGIRATVGRESGKYYWEVTVNNVGTTAGGDFFDIGIANKNFNINGQSAGSINVAAYGNAGMKRGFGADGPTGVYSTFTTGDVIGVLLDLDAHTIAFQKNGTLQFSGSISGTTWYPMISFYCINATATTNFGATSFKYTIPSGYQPYDSSLLQSSPTNLSATVGNGQISLAWDGVTGATSYNMKRSTTAGGPYTSIAQNVSGTSYSDTSVTAGTAYYYVVTAITSGGESANSNEASATVPAPADDRLYVLLDINEQAQLSVSDNLSDNATLTWMSSDPTVATVDANGEVTAIKEGECKITATNSDGTFTDYIPVKVMKGAENFRLALNLKAGESKRLWISDNSSTVSWTTMDPSVATIDNTGKVTAVANGLCIVQGELNGKTYYIYVRVN
ncbi:Ig-like domain-containing protein [Desulfosporosinus sp. PR]|uniref:Ig-like domain-containing protein n=1 Tax=Candidatus Desulfosporosinus nitrosoreducens TaxID=3401928 RepID=UPI0027E62761|nr:Ig-like domain-containing protein [Desulfosporosinus sp. PR]MDQ7094238.1 Ig-like domain-containing protein [Desulfosporosinus sp. PR]